MKKTLSLFLLLLLLTTFGCRSAAVPAAVSVEPVLTPSPSAAPAATSTAMPTSVPTPSPTPEPTPFSMVWMSDTQPYTGGSGDVLASMFDWTCANMQSENIIALLHTGDFVEDQASETQWQNVQEMASVLPPELLCVSACGNHDGGTRGEAPENYLRYRMDTQLDPDASFLDGQCRYVTLKAGGMNILILSIAYMRETESAAWAREVLAAHPDHYGILIAHSYLTESPLEMHQGYTGGGAVLRDKVVKPSPNLHMVLCGHIACALRPLSCDDDGDGQTDRTVHQFMLNFQDANLNNAGYLRILRFDTMDDRIDITTYSPYVDRLGYKNDPLGDVYTIENAGLAAYMMK